jgi:hypothetical protein
MLLTLLVTTCVPFVITAVDAVAACAFLGRVNTSAGLFINTLYTLVNIDKYCIVFAFIIYSLHTTVQCPTDDSCWNAQICNL